MSAERDKGYAWIVAASSSVIMFIGPSTLASYGSIMETVDMSCNYRSWILNTMCILMFATAISMGPLIHIRSTYRKIALVGCLLTACGFLLTGTVLQFPAWLLVTLSSFTGIGFGLAIHATFLLVAFHFTRYRGLANGIGLVSAGAGYLLSPLMYEPIEHAKDKLHLRALVSAVAFMAASFYVSPPPLQEKASFPENLRPRNRPAKPSPNKSLEEDNAIRHEEFPRESIPLVIKDSDEAPPSHLLRPRRQSQFMAAIAGTLLPNIPEESESHEPSLQNLQAKISSGAMESVPPPMREETRTDIGKHMSHLDLEVRLSKAIDKTDASEKQARIDNYGTTASGKALTGMNAGNSPKFKNVTETIKVGSMPRKKLGYSQFRRAMLSKDSKQKNMPKQQSCTNSSSLPQNPSPDATKSCSKQLSNLINFKLLMDPKFLNMAFGCSLTMIVLPNFPIVLYAHVTQSQQGTYVSERNHIPGGDGGEFVLVIIFLLDLLSRLIVSYMSDFSFFNRRVGFLFGALSGAIVIAGIGYVHDIRLIYILAIIYGISFGILVSTESLMFADVFGINQLTSTYGLVGLFKAILITFLSVVFQSPSSSFMYTVHPILHAKARVNGTICANCDPFDLFTHSENPEDLLHHRQYLLGMMALPGFLCAIMWSLEMLAIHIRTQKCQTAEKSQESISSPQV
ncbi:unnamed protein product [Allacma fusca]|uniref:Monocarboxylate transporter n=1 Tax=Allacma fusca TaxID=39272 RepID=A0A8J2KY63_9HEXA|nr:unnamed protein product [Allacma fusca]